jgi:ubiquinone/menaquinone biosynthesis C-methylase UbiE
MLAIARCEAERAGMSIETVCSPAEALAVPDESIDVVTCKQLLHEAADVGRTLREMARVLRSPGLAFVVDFDAQGSYAMALATRTLLRVTRGAAMARDFWRSFRAGVFGGSVRDAMVRAGFRAAEYQKIGFDYFIVGSR